MQAAQAVQLGQVDILVVNGVCLRAAYMRLLYASTIYGSPQYHQQW